ncbi:MAG: diguanylate cyclase [Pseudomonadales bacterium]|nr:diguanylate cyclase [Pseudomonadales bacterium]
MDTLKKVLVIETTGKSISQLEQILSGYYRIAIAFNNDQGFEEAKSADKPDLILISALGELVESYELCTQLKNDMKTYAIPVLFILDRSQELAEYRGFEVGAADYLPFPLLKDVTLARINTYLKVIELEKQVENLEVRDGLTGLYNRSYFEDYFNQEWLRARRSESPLGLMLIEIDGFDEYNKHYGHAALADVLKRLAALIKKRLYRPADMVAKYRVKGYACVLPDTDYPGLRLLAEELMAAVLDLEIKHEFAGRSKLLTISIAADYIVPEVEQCTEFYSSIRALIDQHPSQTFGSIIFPDS